MTDRSNYGPVRRLSPSVSTVNRKPYSRTGLKGVLGTLDLNSGDAAVPTPPDSPYYPFHVETPQLEPPSQNRTAVPDGPRDVAGFPTYEQYQRIEDEYLSSLSERKQPKALITQALFDRIFAVLQNGSEDRSSTAQFRFWVRKMFVLAYSQTHSNDNAGETPELVVLHDKRPVAIKEQLYEVLCYCHAVARHGGRDKTCATLRLNYSWVPKELTAKFVKACPTCTLKRSGNPDLLSHFGRVSSPYVQTVPTPEPASLFPGGPNDSPPGLNFVVESDGCDDGGRGTSIGRSMFATPDLSVYPSPTLSAGSLGPTTPSPFLTSGLFGYPAMFDPGHGSLSSMAGWDPSPFSPCGQMYAEELRPKQERAEEIIDTCARGMQLQLPTPELVRSLRARARGDGDFDDGGCSTEPSPRAVGTTYTIDIDPTLLIEGRNGSGEPYPATAPDAAPSAPSSPSKDDSCVLLQQEQQYPAQFGLALRATTPAMGNGMGTGAGLRMPEPASTPGPRQRQRQQQQRLRQRRLQLASSEAPAATDACSFGGSVPEFLHSFSFPPQPGGGGGGDPSSASSPLPPRAGGGPMMNMMVGVDMGGNILLWRGRGDDVPKREPDLDDGEVSEAELRYGVVEDRRKAVKLEEEDGAAPRWESPEAWLVQSDSNGEAPGVV